MRAFKFDLQRFDVEYEFKSGKRTFQNSSPAYFYSSGRYSNTNYDVLTIGYNIN